MTAILESDAYTNASDPAYMEDVVRGAIGSMYTGAY